MAGEVKNISADKLLDDSKFDLSTLWDQLDSTVYAVLDQNYVNIENIRIRHLDGHNWLYVDDANGYEVLSIADVDNVGSICALDDPRLANVYDGFTVKWFDGRYLEI